MERFDHSAWHMVSALEALAKLAVLVILTKSDCLEPTRAEGTRVVKTQVPKGGIFTEQPPIKACVVWPTLMV